MTKYYIPGYPRPQFVRKDFVDLCGKWFFRFDDSRIGYRQGWHEGFEDMEILVPFSCETVLSGINVREYHECVWYCRTFDAKADARLLLHFDGSDYATTVWINGNCVGSHEGAYSRFSFDISEELSEDGRNTLVVCCEDSMDKGRPRGKQRWMQDNFGCWYVQTTGIWKPVWLETVPELRLDNVKITPDYDNSAVILEYTLNRFVHDCVIEAEVSFQGRGIAIQSLKMNKSKKKIMIDLVSCDMEWGVRHWSPDSPNLYDIEFRVIVCGEVVDVIGSYFGLRKIGIQGSKIMLNNLPFYQKLILDQGYWPGSGLTAPSEQAIIEDIDKIMELGFNGVRKHQKTEDERFAYWCDVKGMLMWCEMPSAYDFDDLVTERYTKEWIAIVRQFYNHPCIITWTPFNESWGVSHVKTDIRQQSFITGIYHITKAIDSMRPVISNDGWEHTCSDIITLHDYEQRAAGLSRYFDDSGKLLGNLCSMSQGRYAFADGWAYNNQPVIISEYGGIAIMGNGEGWGYGERVRDETDFLERYADLTNYIMSCDYICGYCYTQVSDVEQEVNGLMDENRSFKCDPKAIRAVNTGSGQTVD